MYQYKAEVSMLLIVACVCNCELWSMYVVTLVSKVNASFLLDPSNYFIIIIVGAKQDSLVAKSINFNAKPNRYSVFTPWRTN